jgi:hypothetical protein
MMVTVVTNVPTERMAPSTPALGFQNPQTRSAAVSHSDTPRNQVAPWRPNTGYIQDVSGPLWMKGISVWASYSNHFW